MSSKPKVLWFVFLLTKMVLFCSTSVSSQDVGLLPPFSGPSQEPSFPAVPPIYPYAQEQQESTSRINFIDYENRRKENINYSQYVLHHEYPESITDDQLAIPRDPQPPENFLQPPDSNYQIPSNNAFSPPKLQSQYAPPKPSNSLMYPIWKPATTRSPIPNFQFGVTRSSTKAPVYSTKKPILNIDDDDLSESDIIANVFNINASIVESVEPIRRPAIEACERYSVLPISHIAAGDLAELKEFPWMAALVYLGEFNYDVSFDCGGTIISESFVLTAAHCMKYRPPSAVRVGKLSLIDKKGDRATNYHIKDIVMHPYWSSVSKKNDIALLRLAKKIEFTDIITPACLATELNDLPSGTKVTVTGWGTTSTDHFVQSSELRKTQLTAVPLFECNQIYLKYNERAKLPAFENGISVSQFCAHDPVNHSDSCQGDSGGPVQYFPARDSLAHVVGIVSFGISCGTELPGIYTRVAYYIDWIESVVWPK